MTTTLLLNADFSAINVVNIQRAISLILSGKASVVESVQGKFLRSPSLTMEVPSILVLKRYVRVPKRHATYSRRAIFVRDGYICSYCGAKLDHKTATVDHIVPVSECNRLHVRASTWVNCTTACARCNFKKGKKSLRDAGMRFADPAYSPRIPRVNYVVAHGNIPDNWRVYVEV